MHGSASLLGSKPRVVCLLLGAALLQLAPLPPACQALNPVLDINGTYPYLLDRVSGLLVQPRDYMDFDNVYAPNSTYSSQQTAASRNYHLIKAFDFANYFQSDYWRYSSDKDLRESAWPVANQSLCASQLAWLERQLNKSHSLFARGQQHANLMNYVDSFGRPTPATFHGKAHWLGSYFQCKRTQIDALHFEREEAANGEQRFLWEPLIKTRYCVAKVRDRDWPDAQQDNYTPTISYKVGVCLPESCHSDSYRRQPEIERLMLYSMPHYMRQRLLLAGLYCLPDARSPLRKLGTSARLFLMLCLCWLAAVLLATALHFGYRSQRRDMHRMNRQVRKAITKQELPLTAPNQRRSQASGALKSQTRAHVECVQESRQAHYASGAPANAAAAAADQLLLAGDHQQATGGSISLQDLCRLETAEGSAGDEQKGVALLSGAHFLVQMGNKPRCPAAAAARQLLSGPSEAPAIASYQDSVCRLQNCENCQELLSADQRSTSSSSHHSSSLSNWLLAETKESSMLLRVSQAMSIIENVAEFQRRPEMLRTSEKIRVNLNALDAIKCFCCILVIFGHIVFIHMQHISDVLHTIEQSNLVYVRFLIAFFNFVDTFFIISGILTSYFVFKRFNERTFARLSVWLSVTFLRLVRLSPVYLLVFWFTKTLAVHLFDGPMWDYGTDKNSIHGLCINDHWWKSILYLGNYGTMQPLCILPAWSIIVDSQYSIILPPLLYLLFKHRKWAYASLLAAVLVSTLNMSHQLSTQTAVRASDMSKVRLHVYPLISRFAAEFYNTPWNRIGPLAIGIIGGFKLYQYDVGLIAKWPRYMRGAFFKAVLFMHAFIFILPTLGYYTESAPVAADAAGSGGAAQANQQSSDLAIFVLSNAAIKPIWSILNTILLLRLMTDLRRSSFVARFMSDNIWHCLGKLCFASYLIHYEIIIILLKSRSDGPMEPSWTNGFREFSLTFLISTVLAYFIHILFESPINRLFNLSFRQSMNKERDPNSKTNYTAAD